MLRFRQPPLVPHYLFESESLPSSCLARRFIQNGSAHVLSHRLTSVLPHQGPSAPKSFRSALPESSLGSSQPSCDHSGGLQGIAPAACPNNLPAAIEGFRPGWLCDLEREMTNSMDKCPMSNGTKVSTPQVWGLNDLTWVKHLAQRLALSMCSMNDN